MRLAEFFVPERIEEDTIWRLRMRKVDSKLLKVPHSIDVHLYSFNILDPVGFAAEAKSQLQFFFP